MKKLKNSIETPTPKTAEMYEKQISWLNYLISNQEFVNDAQNNLIRIVTSQNCGTVVENFNCIPIFYHIKCQN